jgi:salicylate hydroxylase
MARRAIIAGAGIGGLSTALALAQAGFEVAVYERAEAFEEFGAGLQLTPNATRVLARLGALAGALKAAMAPQAILTLRGSDDSELLRLPLDDAERRWGAPYLTIHRADLQRALAEAVRRRPGVSLTLDVSLTGLASESGRVAVALKRGPSAMRDVADLLIGADGLRSVVRESLVRSEGAEAAFAGRIAFRATVEARLVDRRWLRPVVVLRLGPKAHLVHYPLRGGSVANIVAVVEQGWRKDTTGDLWDGDADKRVLDRAFASWSPETRALITAASVWRAWPLYVRPPIPSFSLGRAALVGDAAHPMVPFLAQGAAQAIEDAGALGRIFSQTDDVPSGLAEYSRDRAARANQVQAESAKLGRIYHLSGPLALARDAAMRLIGPRRLSARYDWLYGA